MDLRDWHFKKLCAFLGGQDMQGLKFEEGDYTTTDTGAFIINHSLGVKPRFAIAYLKSGIPSARSNACLAMYYQNFTGYKVDMGVLEDRTTYSTPTWIGGAAITTVVPTDTNVRFTYRNGNYPVVANAVYHYIIIE